MGDFLHVDGVVERRRVTDLSLVGSDLVENINKTKRKQEAINVKLILDSSVSDPHFFADIDPDPGKNLHTEFFFQV